MLYMRGIYTEHFRATVSCIVKFSRIGSILRGNGQTFLCPEADSTLYTLMSQEFISKNMRCMLRMQTQERFSRLRFSI